MKLHYYPETDSLYIEFKGTPGVEARQIVEGLVVDLDAKGDVVDWANNPSEQSQAAVVAMRSLFIW